MPVTLRPMTAADIPLGMRLKQEAGWNQTLTDWQRFLAIDPDGSFVASVDGVDLGTVATFRFGDIAWIAMVLVDVRSRGQGVGTALMTHALKHLEQAGVKSVRLDATPLGKPVYLKLGFVEQFELTRYAGTLTAMFASTHAGAAEPIAASDHEAIYQLDREVMQTDRKQLLEALLADESAHASVVKDGDHVLGFCLSRPGANAAFIGPCIALTHEAGLTLLHNAAQPLAGKPVLIDIPVDHVAATQWAREMGLTPQRPLTRMTLGTPVLEKVKHLWASSGPEKG